MKVTQPLLKLALAINYIFPLLFVLKSESENESHVYIFIFHQIHCLSLIRLDVSVEITPCLFVVNTILSSCFTPRRFTISLERILLENSMLLIFYMSENKFNFFQLESNWIFIQLILQFENF